MVEVVKAEQVLGDDLAECRLVDDSRALSEMVGTKWGEMAACWRK